MLLGVIPPFLLQTDDNPKGVPGSVFDGIKEAIVADRYAYFDAFYNTDVLAPERIGEAAVRASFPVAASASPYASYACWTPGRPTSEAICRRSTFRRW